MLLKRGPRRGSYLAHSVHRQTLDTGEGRHTEKGRQGLALHRNGSPQGSVQPCLPERAPRRDQSVESSLELRRLPQEGALQAPSGHSPL